MTVEGGLNHGERRQGRVAAHRQLPLLTVVLGELGALLKVYNLFQAFVIRSHIRHFLL